eukprot:69127-Amorphochlora_amoeboformis.AAC.1
MTQSEFESHGAHCPVHTTGSVTGANPVTYRLELCHHLSYRLKWDFQFEPLVWRCVGSGTRGDMKVLS